MDDVPGKELEVFLSVLERLYLKSNEESRSGFPHLMQEVRMWILYACGSAFFAGITAILAKCGIRETDSAIATAIRTIVVLVFSWIMAAITSPISAVFTIDSKTWIFLVLSGLATGASWLCYFHALQKGDVSKVVPIDKSSTILTMVLAVLLLGESNSASGILAMILIGVGTLMMIEKKASGDAAEGSRYWIIYALLSALFASLTSILGKIGIEGIDSNLGTAIRTAVVLVMSWLMVAVTGKRDKLMAIPRNELFFIIISGFATGASWLCYYRALQEGPASVVVPIDKLSILVTIIFSRIVFHEHLSRKALIGLLGIFAGTLLIALPSLI